MELLKNLTTMSNREQYVSFDQFMESCNKFLGKHSGEDITKNVFFMFSESPENPVITLSSFRRMLNELGDEMTDEESKEVFERNAGDKNVLNYEDFLKIFKK